MRVPLMLQRMIGSCAFVSMTVLAACAGDDPVAVDSNYAGPGSKWEVSMKGDGTFTISKRQNATAPIEFTITGSWTTSTTGFRQLSVKTVTGTGGPNVGDTAWAVEVPGYALMLKPVEPGSDQLIAMVESGQCPVTDLSANWIMVRKTSGMTDALNASRDYFGTYAWTAADKKAALPAKYALAGNFNPVGQNDQIGATNCQDGLNHMPDVNATMYLTSNGGAMVHLEDGGESDIIFALGKKAIGPVTNINGSYVGMAFDASRASGQRLTAASMTCSAGVCSGTLLSGPQSGATASDPWTITLNGTPDDLGDGWITGTVSDNTTSNSGAIACMVDVDANESGKKIVSCVGQTPNDNNRMGNFLFTTT